jgi:hypothetical protein
MLNKIKNWKKVVTNNELLDAIENSAIDEVATMAQLRNSWSMNEITLAAELIDARKRAKGKLTNYKSVIADSEGVQQATSSAIASHKAKRFAGSANVFDLCCGIGSDLNELPEHSIGVDIDGLRCWMAEQNTGKTVVLDDATKFKMPKNSVLHIDPARRNKTGRRFELESMIPPFSEVTNIASNCSGGCIKLSPVVNQEDIESISLPFEIEYFEENNRLVQAAVWFGSLTNNPNGTTATSMKLDQSFSGTPTIPSFNTELKGWIHEPNIALERAGLHGTLGNSLNASEPSPGIGLLTSSEKLVTPWFTSFEVIATTALRLEKVAKKLIDLKCTQVEVKTRDKTIDPNQWQIKLNKKPTGELLTVFGLRLGSRRCALITRRCVKQ